MAKFRKQAIRIVSMLGVTSMLAGFCFESFDFAKDDTTVSLNSGIKKVNANVKHNVEDYFDSNVVYRLPDELSGSEEISVIVKMDTTSLVDAYNQANTSKTASEFATTAVAQKITNQVSRDQNTLIRKLKKSDLNYTLGAKYDTVLSGFEVTIKASDFETLGELVGENATLIIGDEFEPAQVQEVITNEVDVYDTGIFDSSASEYQGDGVVVAVLDTGLDYTHSAFSAVGYNPEIEAFTLDSVDRKIDETTAARYTAGLTAQDVYISKKVPYAYDYADKDPDVLPINSEHGTHVAGIIAGKDARITGVAPMAQLAIMKVFSDSQQGAKTSWILSALEDCVTLGVDVINMSLGSSCGFTRLEDEQNLNDVYESIRTAGISLIAAASNDANSTRASEKNGSNPLTSNPDSGTVGAPSTYGAALSVASVDGVKTPYLLYDERIIYFTEASTSDAKTKHFVEDVLKTRGDGVDSHTFEYVTIPGVGRSADYPEEDDFYNGKIVLVKRGQTTFEDKVRVALKEKGAAGIIIYNNVSGTISMAVGEDVGAVCSITQDEGELLAKSGSGYIQISKDQVAGPFMSDFSSWGPTSDLKIKPEITAHGGEIESAVPGQDYDRLSGTSMAAPNQAGATALIRQYVKYSEDVFGTLTPVEVTALVNQIMMSTTDIVRNKNGLPFAVRKQGAGLVNIMKASTAEAYLTTNDANGNVMDKTKLELGDDKEKTGVYTMSFTINNISNAQVAYDVSSIVMTEGVSPTYTSHDDTTSTQEGYLLSGATTTIIGVSGGTQTGMKVSVAARQKATVTVQIKLSDADKQYIESSFAHGMYVEGFIKLDAAENATVDLNVPMLAFYGDWTEAPVFDEEYYDTNVDELNAGLDAEDKVMADAYATRAIGSLYSDYIATLGTYFFTQDPSATPIAANKEHIAISNQEGDEKGFTVKGLAYIWAGLLRNAKQVQISIVEDSTGKEIFYRENYDQNKSYSYGNSIRLSSIEVDFNALEQKLKNNTKYTVTITTYIDYGTHEHQDETNTRNVFQFPLFIDFESPVVTDVNYRAETDRTTKKTKLFADINIYDNHYAMAAQIGQIIRHEDPLEPNIKFSIDTFGKYVTPVYSEFNSTSTITVELTDYVAQIKKNSVGALYPEDGGEVQIIDGANTFIVYCYDYAMNSAMYEIELPDEIIDMAFTEEEITLRPNGTQDLSTILSVFPNESWIEMLTFSSDNPSIADVVNQTVIAKSEGTATITATGKKSNGDLVTAQIKVKVEGAPITTAQGVNKFSLTGYTTKKAYYSIDNDDRDIGETDGTYSFGSTNSIEMYPSESIKINYTLDSYLPTTVSYKVGNSKIATVDDNGVIVAKAKGSTYVSVTVMRDGKATLYSEQINIKVKDPFTTSSIYLMSYKGLGGEVIIPSDRGITTIYDYAFSNYKYVDKDVKNGDVIDEEDPLLIKQQYIGENTITKVVIPEGVTHINSYAFAGLSALEEIVLPKSLKTIGIYAFYNCKKLKKINLENVKFINEKAFENCALEEMNVSSVVAIGNYSFANCNLNYVELPDCSQSLGIGAFSGNEYLESVKFNAEKIKIGQNAFEGCSNLKRLYINAAVIAANAFNGCSSLWEVTLGKDVAVIGEFAFANTNVASFEVEEGGVLYTNAEKTFVFKKNDTETTADDELVLVAPAYGGVGNTITTTAKTIASGAFAGNVKVFSIVAQNATSIGNYAFAGCTNLASVDMDNLEQIGNHAFADTMINKTPKFDKVNKIGDSAFAGTKITSLKLADNVEIGTYAFAYCEKLTSVEIGNNVTIGDYAFYCPVDVSHTIEVSGLFSMAYYTKYDYVVKDEASNKQKTYSYYRYNFLDNVTSSLTSLSIGADATLGNYAFAGNAKLVTFNLGDGASLGDYAFYDAVGLSNLDLSGVKSIGAYAFTGTRTQDFAIVNNTLELAYERKYENDEIVNTAFVYTQFAPSFDEANLANVAFIGEHAFANNTGLNSVIFGDKLTSISPYAFYGCTSIATSPSFEKITEVGEYAFYGAKFAEVDLINVVSIGQYAFANNNSLAKVTLKAVSDTEAGAKVGVGAFANCGSLATVVNLPNVDTIGAYAFYGTAITELVLTNVKEVGDFAFGASKVAKVTLGDKLTTLGANPFYATQVATFGVWTDVTFNDKVVDKQYTTTYDVSETVKIIDDVLYLVVSNGLELISYPIGKTDANFTVAEGTVKISDRAFAGAVLENVVLSTTLKAIGDKAFYGCEKLSVVVFTGYYAPMLEEEYDTSYISLNNMPQTGSLVGYDGLGIVKYNMWNVASSYNNFYFGANFVDYIGHVTNNVVMVKPANGKNYDTFIFSKYFVLTVEGGNAMTETTIKVIAMIAALPDSITLSHEAQVAEARAAYDQIPELEQKALVSNYSKLTSAESTITYLKLRNEQPDVDPVTPDEEGLPTYAIILIVVGGVLLLGAAGWFAYVKFFKNKAKTAKEETDAEDETQTDAEIEAEAETEADVNKNEEE